VLTARQAILLGLTLLLSIQALPITPTLAQSRGRVLILSSLERYVPMGQSDSVKKYLESAGYGVTFLADASVTLDVLTKQLSGYDIVIWRTNAYDWNHVMYWYVGELDNRATREHYSSDFDAGWADNTNGILGVSVDFFMHHFSPGSLGNIKLAILVSTDSAFVGSPFLKGGVKSTIDYYQPISLSFDTTDYVVTMIVRYLSNGNTVKDSVWEVVSAFLYARHSDPLDEAYVPPVWWMGDGTVTITGQ
jgi:hypothetical protein